MPCWPELWESARSLIWWAIPLGVVAAVVLLLWAPNIKKRWLLLTMRIAGSLIAGAILILVLPAVILGSFLASGNPKPDIQTISSPSRKHDAVLLYQAGFLGRDYTSVKLKSSGCCQHFLAFEHSGPSDVGATNLTWIDDSHLRIDVDYVRAGDPWKCNDQVAGVKVSCVAHTSPSKSLPVRN